MYFKSIGFQGIVCLAVSQTLGACVGESECPPVKLERPAVTMVAAADVLQSISLLRQMEVGNMQGAPSNGLYYLAVCLTCRLGSAITTDPSVCVQWGQFHSANNPTHNVVLRSASNPAVLAP